MSPLTKVLIGAFLVLLAALAVSSWQLTTANRRIQALGLAPAKAATVTAAARVETVTVYLAAIHDTVTRLLRDTLWRAAIVTTPPKTHEDTVRSVVQLPIVVAAYDSLHRSCFAFVVTCDAYKAAAESRFAADSVYQMGLESALHASQPGRLAAIWNRVKLPLAFGGGLYLGLRAR